MVSSGRVNSDLASIKSSLSNYDNLIGDMSNSWKGISYDNLVDAIETAVGSTIKTDYIPIGGGTTAVNGLSGEGDVVIVLPFVSSEPVLFTAVIRRDVCKVLFVSPDGHRILGSAGVTFATEELTYVCEPGTNNKLLKFYFVPATITWPTPTGTAYEDEYDAIQLNGGAWFVTEMVW